jgi:hypothetical protein
MAEVVSNADASQNFDSEQAKEAITAGEQKAPEVDVAADYEASKQFSVSEIDQTEEGAKAAAEATAPQFELPQPTETRTVAEPTSDPQDYLEMAKDVSPAPAGATNVTDDLVAKALELGKPGESQ